MDVPDAKEVCRTCLKRINADSSLLRLSDCCTPQKTYGQILEDYAQFEFKEEQESKLPQVLCALCCRHLKRIHSFISRAQICNLQLVEIAEGSNQLDCLQEEVIDFPVKVEGDVLTGCGEESTANETGDVPVGNYVKNELMPYSYCTIVDQCHTVDLTGCEEHIGRSAKEQTENEHQSSLIIFPEKNTDQNSIKSTCPICSKVLKRRMYMLNHLRKVHHIDNAGNFLKKLMGKQKNAQAFGISKCTQCDYLAKNSAALTYHSRTRHATESDKYKCKFCSFESLKRWALVGHIKNEHKLEFKTLKKTVEKKQTISELGTDSDACDPSVHELSLEDSSDDDGFIRAMIKEERRIVRSKYVDGEPYNSLARKCEDCGKVYKNFQSLYAHKRFVHISEDMYSVCLHCGKKYKRSQDLKNHILQSHTNAHSSTSGAIQIPEVQGKRFMCTECPYASTTTTHLKIHIRRHHTGEKPYVCEICGNSFLTLYCLKNHIYLHTGEKPHKCSYCPKTFRIAAKLKKHKRVHTGERPYKCTECGKGFTQDYNLSVHKRIHNKSSSKSSSYVNH